MEIPASSGALAEGLMTALMVHLLKASDIFPLVRELQCSIDSFEYKSIWLYMFELNQPFDNF
jgi:hypothetical protein